MKHVKLALLYALCAPTDILALFAGLLVALLTLSPVRGRRGVIWVLLRTDSWLGRIWRYSTTLGHVILLRADHVGTQVERHELVHVRQSEAHACAAWIVVALAGLASLWLPLWSVGLGVITTGYWLSYAGASVAAWLRGGRSYEDNIYERHAHAETDLPSEPITRRTRNPSAS